MPKKTTASKEGKGGDEQYAVGYGCPPREHQFRKGQSGNRAGRPKGSRSLSTILNAELSEKITVMIGGRSQRITKAEAILKQMTNGAVKGDPKARRDLLPLMREVENANHAASAAQVLHPDDKKVLAMFIKDIQDDSRNRTRK